MRSSIILASLALVTYSAAQDATSLPACAQICLAPFASSSGIAGCKAIDIGCICASGGFLNDIGCCLLASCSESDQQAAIQFAASICKSAGITVPTDITCSSTSAGSSSTVDTAALSSTISSVSSAISSAISSVSSELSSFSSIKSESSESVASTSSSASSAATASTTKASSGGSATSAVSSVASAASSAASSTGAAAGHLAVGGSGIVGGVLAALALL